tara:strand:- start:8151 stop:8378 length:228 start_codon:yes stop_codon:yes gene_type:complete
MINDYQTGSMLFYDGDVGTYYYGTILSVAVDVTRNHVYMTVLNRNGEVCNLNLDEEAMKQWTTEHSFKRSDCIAM